MNYRTALLATFAFAIGTATSLNSANAQVQRTWVASSGNDNSANCTRAAPCRSFYTAYAKTAAGGEITCVDSAPYGLLNISKSITISCLNADGTGGSTTGSYTENFAVFLNPSDRVLLRGLDIDVAGQTSSAINFTGAGTLVLERVKISGAYDSGNAVTFSPNGAGRLIVTDSIFNFSGGPVGGAGIRVYPSGIGTAQIALERVTIAGNQFGLAIDGSNSTGGINATISDSFFGGNVNDGIVATSSPSTAPVGLTVINSRSVNNGFGIRSIGSNVTVRVKDSSIIGNGVGLSGGGALLSGGGNTVQANGTNGSFTGSFAQQ